jgi:hypothetical protein
MSRANKPSVEDGLEGLLVDHLKNHEGYYSANLLTLVRAAYPEMGWREHTAPEQWQTVLLAMVKALCSRQFDADISISFEVDFGDRETTRFSFYAFPNTSKEKIKIADLSGGTNVKFRIKD